MNNARRAAAPSMLAFAASLLAFFLACSTLLAQDPQGDIPDPSPPVPPPSLDKARNAFRDAIERNWVPRYRLTNGPHVRAAFRNVVADVSQSTVAVEASGKRVALGGIVGPDGWVLTKASQLRGPLTVVLKDKREFDARLVGVDREHDLAMLKVDAKDLPSLSLEKELTISAGGWVATPGLERDPLAVGVMSVAPRKIPHRPGILGIQLDDSDSTSPRASPQAEGEPDAEQESEPTEKVTGALVVKVFPDTGAAKAGVLVNDVVTRINGQRTKNRLQLIREVRRYSPGDEIELEIRRGSQTVTLKATLSGNVKQMFPQTRSQYQNSLGGELSQRRFGFPTALQHDTVLRPNECGGPLVNLDGQVIGFNISRSGRTESYAIPTDAVLSLMYELMSGKQTPEQQ